MTNLTQKQDSFIYTTADEGDVVKFEIYYTKGGANYFQGGMTRRGIFASIRKTKIEKHDGYTTESFEIFGSGGKALVKELARKSDKELLKAAEALDQYVPDICKNFEADPQLGKNALLAAAQSIQTPEAH